MSGVSKKGVNLTHFNTNPNFVLALWKDLADTNQKQLKVLKKKLFSEFMGERIIWAPNTQYMAT